VGALQSGNCAAADDPGIKRAVPAFFAQAQVNAEPAVRPNIKKLSPSPATGGADSFFGV